MSSRISALRRPDHVFRARLHDRERRVRAVLRARQRQEQKTFSRRDLHAEVAPRDQEPVARAEDLVEVLEAFLVLDHRLGSRQSPCSRSSSSSRNAPPLRSGTARRSQSAGPGRTCTAG